MIGINLITHLVYASDSPNNRLYQLLREPISSAQNYDDAPPSDSEIMTDHTPTNISNNLLPIEFEEFFSRNPASTQDLNAYNPNALPKKSPDKEMPLSQSAASSNPSSSSFSSSSGNPSASPKADASAAGPLAPIQNSNAQKPPLFAASEVQYGERSVAEIPRIPNNRKKPSMSDLVRRAAFSKMSSKDSGLKLPADDETNDSNANSDSAKRNSTASAAAETASAEQKKQHEMSDESSSSSASFYPNPLMPTPSAMLRTKGKDSLIVSEPQAHRTTADTSSSSTPSTSAAASACASSRSVPLRHLLKQKKTNFRVLQQTKENETENNSEEENDTSDVYQNDDDVNNDEDSQLAEDSLQNSLPKKGNCPTCDKYCNNLPRHMLVHSDEKPYKCPQCEYRCKREDYLPYHMQTHKKELKAANKKTERSSTITASAKTIAAKQLKKRKKTENGRKGYCPHCSKFYTNLPNHIITHTNETPFECPYCPHQCNRESNMKTHVLSIHKKIYTGNVPKEDDQSDNDTAKPARKKIKTDILKNKIVSANAQGMYECEYENCNATFDTLKSVHLHAVKAHSSHAPKKEHDENSDQSEIDESEQTEFACTEDDCNKTFSSVRALNIHIAKIHTSLSEEDQDESDEVADDSKKISSQSSSSSAASNIQCPYCDETFKKTTGLGSHIHHKHPASSANQNDDEDCDEESASSSTQHATIETHSSAAAATSASQNDSEDDIPLSKRSGKKNIKNAQTESSTNLLCPHCNAPFKKTCGLTSHIKNKHPFMSSSSQSNNEDGLSANDDDDTDEDLTSKTKNTTTTKTKKEWVYLCTFSGCTLKFDTEKEAIAHHKRDHLSRASSSSTIQHTERQRSMKLAEIKSLLSKLSVKIDAYEKLS